jgi:hypothetical protein
VGFFDIFPFDDQPSFNGAWSNYPFFPSGSVVVNGIEQGLFVVRPRVSPQGLPAGLRVTLAGPGSAAPVDRDWSYVVRVVNQGPYSVSDAQLLHMPPSTSQLLSARASQGECTVTTIVSCNLQTIAAGSEAFVFVTIRAPGEGDYVSTAVATAIATDGSKQESSALAMTRGVRHVPALSLRRPMSDTVFWIGRNNTIQWTLRGVAGRVSIDLSRDDGASWTRLIDEAENVGFYDWTGTGDATLQARIRVTSVARPELSQTSPAFSIRPIPGRSIRAATR